MRAVGQAEAAGALQRERRTALALLVLVYTCNSAQRSLIPVIGQAMKLDLRLSDTQLGLLAGTAFAALYALSGIPTARLAERVNRVWLLAVALAVWSGFTTVFAATGSYLQLVLARIGVGVGEAGCSPCAHSLISDYYERGRRTSALAVYSCGLSLGYLFVAMVGGYVTLHYGWRAACIAIGAPGILLALVLRVSVREPVRGLADGAPAAPAAPFSLGGELQALGAVLRTLFLSYPAANLIAGLTVSSFASYGSWAFIPAYYPRAFGLDYATSGLVLGIVGSVPVALGTLAGGYLSDFLGARSARWYALVPALGLLCATPFYVASFLSPDWRVAAVLLAIPGFFQYTSLAPSFGVVQNLVPARARATATALLFLCLNVVALGGGALFTGFLIDHLAGAFHAHPGSGSWRALAEALRPGGTVAQFRLSCPGGAAPAGSPAAAVAACSATLRQASRLGILVTVTLHLWAALHYLLASRGLRAQLDRAAAA